MTEPEQASAEPAQQRDPAKRIAGAAKGCGCVTVSVILASSVAVAAGGDAGAWAAGIAGVLFLVMVVATSGSNGFGGFRG